MSHSFETTICVQDQEYPCTVTYRDDATYHQFIKYPSPEITIEQIEFCPHGDTVYPLIGEGFDWVLHKGFIEELRQEIRQDIIDRFQEAKADAGAWDERYDILYGDRKYG